MPLLDANAALAKGQLEQMLVEFWREIDRGGRNATEFFTEDCVAESGAINFQGHVGVKTYYEGRLQNIRANQKDGVRTSRHTFLNFGAEFETENRATLTFLICTFAGEGHPPVMGATNPVAISDARFECRREAHGKWRIFGFYGTPIFISDEPFAVSALVAR